jgi:hypothetical protein
MSDPDTLVISSDTSQGIMRAVSAAIPQLPVDVRRRLNFISMRYWQLYGFEGTYERLNNRTVSTILTEFAASGDDPKPIATGQVGDTRYTLFEAPQKKHGSEESDHLHVNRLIQGNELLSQEGTGPAPSPLKVITNSIGIKLVQIPAGEFLMGSPDSATEKFEEEKPQHRVRITLPFYLGATPVTQGQYRAVTGANPSHFMGSDDLPVEQVSWEHAQAFCDRLNGLELRELGDERYRLPTEAE